MRIEIRPLLIAAGLALGMVPASYSSAQPTAQQQQARLEQAAQRNESELRTTRGSHPELRRQQQQIEDAMRRLKAGQKVTTAEIDQILGEESFERAK